MTHGGGMARVGEPSTQMHARRAVLVTQFSMLAVWLLPTRAHAEVLDKFEMPWAPSQLCAALLAGLVCAGLLFVRVSFARRAAYLLASGWAVYRVAYDPLFDPAVGQHLHAELGPSGIARWAFGLALVAVAPLGIVCACDAVRTRFGSRTRGASR